jgi:hypothetical protein
MVRVAGVSMIKYEVHLQERFLTILENDHSLWGNLKYSEQFNYSGGRTDVIALDSSSMVYAFELKLEKWKIALNQAYRNANFANKSYVVLPKKSAMRAIKFKEEFERRSVGLCYIDGNNLIKLIDIKPSSPVITWLNEKAKSTLIQRDENF